MARVQGYATLQIALVPFAVPARRGSASATELLGDAELAAPQVERTFTIES